MLKPSYSVWLGILEEYVSPSRKTEFAAHLARLWSSWGHVWQIEQPHRLDREDSNQEKVQQQKRKREIQSGWTDHQQAVRQKGTDIDKKLLEVSASIAYLTRKAQADKKSKRHRQVPNAPN